MNRDETLEPSSGQHVVRREAGKNNLGQFDLMLELVLYVKCSSNSKSRLLNPNVRSNV